MAATSSKHKIKEETVQKSVNALLKWKQNNNNNKSISQSDLEIQQHQLESEGDDFIYLSITLKKNPSKTLTPNKITLPHSLLPSIPSNLNLCLIVDGKKITSQSAHVTLSSKGVTFIKRVLKLSKLKSDYKSFESKKRLYDSFDAFLADECVVPLLPNVLGKVFYGKKRKIPVPVDLKGDWKEEIEKALNSSLLWLSSGTCSAVRVGRWGVNEGSEIVENVFEAVDGVLEVVPRRWRGVRCLHLKFSDSVALPIYESRDAVRSDGGELGEGGGLGLVGKKRRRGELVGNYGRKKMVG